MAEARPAIVLVHGGWHTPKSYSKFSAALQSIGHEIYIPVLPSMNGSRPPTAHLSHDTAVIRDYVGNLVHAGRSVVVIMHSYGGQVGTNALMDLGKWERQERGLPGGISQLIYVTAFALDYEESMMDMVKRFGNEDLIPLVFDFDDDKTVVARDPKTVLVGEALSEDEMEGYLATLGRWNGKCMCQALEHVAWLKIDVAYVFTTKDMCVPLAYQKDMVMRMCHNGRDVRTAELETGHCPNITMPEELALIVDDFIQNQE
jgi:pimeloyl-ACP methyl ester carboxylesterase